MLSKNLPNPLKKKDKVSVLFVCLGNICRSPTAEGMFRDKVAASELGGAIHIDSAGTGDWHIGRPPDTRAQHAARGRGYDIGDLRARQVSAADFALFDYILAMDAQNLQDLQVMRPANFTGHLGLMLQFDSSGAVTEVPDPYFGGEEGFQRVLDLLEAASQGLLDHIRSQHFAR
ncbi:MAG: low molecular weight protein-tyrosine-phosphatase [Porticoccaceae bacterium]